MTAEPTLSQRELNRALLARQLLLERTGDELPRTLERMGLLQAQYAPSMYVGLWSRVRGFQRADLDGALERREVVLAWLMRITIHLAARADFWPVAIAVRSARRRVWLRSRGGAFSDDEMAAAAERVRSALAGGAILNRKELDRLVGNERAAGVGLWVDLVRAPPSGTWVRRRADLFALAEDWLGPPPAEATAEAGVELLVRRYLAGFGPATPGEIADWAGLGVREIAAALERIELRPLGGGLLDLPGAPLPDADTPAPARFLATFDAALLAHARRTQIVPEAHRPRIFNTKTPHPAATFLVDGAVAGTWRHEDGRIVLDPFEPLDAADRRALEDEGERLAELFRS